MGALLAALLHGVILKTVDAVPKEATKERGPSVALRKPQDL